MRRDESALSRTEGAKLKIGSLELASPFVLAPIAGLTDRVFRAMALEHGAGLVFSELISANGLIRLGKGTLELMPIESEPRPFGVQLFGGEPDLMAEAARIALERSSPDLIDLNYGCPVKKVIRSGAGAALLKDTKSAASVARAVVDAVDGAVPVTVKIRSGFSAESINAIEIARALEDVGVSAVTLHARSARAGYSGEADWSLIARLAAAIAIPLIGNGDINSARTALDRLVSSGSAGVMIGRAALGALDIFTNTARLYRGEPEEKISIADRARVALDLIRRTRGLYGDFIARKKVKAHVGYWLKDIPGAARVRARISRADSVESQTRLIEEFFNFASNVDRGETVGSLSIKCCDQD